MNDINKIIGAINKKYKKDIVVQGNKIQRKDMIPFSSPQMNYLTRGGIAMNKMTEFSGAEGSAKTTSALDIIKNYQQRADARYTVFMDLENTLDEEWASKIGVDMEKVITIKPQEEWAEQLLDMLMDTIRTGDVGLVIVDSIPFLISKQEFDKTMDEKTMGGNSAVLTTFCRKVVPLLHKYNCTSIMINQLRDKMGVTYTAYNTVGGRMLKHSFAQRLFFRKGSLLDANYSEKTSSFEEPVAHIVDVLYKKNKVTRNDRVKGSYILNYEKGIDVFTDTIDLAVLLGIVVKSGSWFYYGEEKWQGKASMRNYLQENNEMFEQIKSETMRKAVE